MSTRRIPPALAGLLVVALALAAAPAGAGAWGSTRKAVRHPGFHVSPSGHRDWKAGLHADLSCHAAAHPWLARFLERLEPRLRAQPRAAWRAGHGRARPLGPFAWGLLRILRAWLGPCTPPPPPDAEPAGGTPLLDDAGRVIAELGDVGLGADADAVPIGAAFADPVVILGPPSADDPEPGAARVTDVSGGAFEARFEEWPYLDGVHAAETAAYLVVESGRHVLADGSVWEAGSLELDGLGLWRSHTFDAAFPAPPLLFLTVQTRNEDEAVAVRARAVGEAAFEAALFEEEAATDGHAPERVGYLAVWSPPRSGRLASDGASLPYLGAHVRVTHERMPVLSHALWLEEETSADDEVVHRDEEVAVLAIGPRLFAQETSGLGGDKAVPRRASPALAVDVEWGLLPELDDAWRTLPLVRTYENPVVVVRPLSSRDAQPAVVRVRNAGADAFEARVEEWAYLDGAHAPERAFYLVAEAGVQSLAGLVLEASRLETGRVLAEGPEPVAFAAPFADAPAVFASVMSEAGPEPVTLRIASRSATGFEVALQEEQADTDGHAVETVGWIAVQRGRGLSADGRVVRVFDSLLDPALRAVPFGETLRGLPTVVAQVASVRGTDPVDLREAGLTPDDVVLFLQEEQSFDPELNHAEEDISLFVAE